MIYGDNWLSQMMLGPYEFLPGEIMDYAIQSAFHDAETQKQTIKINSSQLLKAAVQTSAFYSLSPCNYTTEGHKDK